MQEGLNIDDAGELGLPFFDLVYDNNLYHVVDKGRWCPRNSLWRNVPLC